ncbi:MAG: transposase [Leptolyngbya sp. SIO4C1]|nr:transposase [Leptolyngbya sp. SIO4C1]
MEIYERIEQIVVTLRPAFSRAATYEWFVLLLWGVLLTNQPAAVSSYVNGIGLSEDYYHQALHWFHSSAFSIDQLCNRWGEWLRASAHSKRLRGQLVYVGDGIKVGKEGRQMPGVKGLHQESADVHKPTWIRGHYFSALGLLQGSGKALFWVPMILKLHDGIESAGSARGEKTLVDKMAELCIEQMAPGSYGLLDAYYATVKVLRPFRQKGLHLITRARISTVACAAFCRCPAKHGPGRPRKWGSQIQLKDLFAPLAQCAKASVWLYGKPTTVHYQTFLFHWDDADELVLFVLTQLPCGRRIILLSSDINLTGSEVIEAYGWRFKIEVTFRTLVHLLGGFAYRFWLKLMDPSSQWPERFKLDDYHPLERLQIEQKVEAFERFVNLNAIALGLLQILALEMPQQIWARFPRWFRTLPKHGYPSEQIVRISLQQQRDEVLSKSMPQLLLAQLLASKSEAYKSPNIPNPDSLTLTTN